MLASFGAGWRPHLGARVAEGDIRAHFADAPSTNRRIATIAGDQAACAYPTHPSVAVRAFRFIGAEMPLPVDDAVVSGETGRTGESPSIRLARLSFASWRHT